MLAFIRYTAGLGNTAIYARLRNATGQFWNFVGTAWVGTETADCKVNMPERDDSDTVDSLYVINLTMPSGGPWIQEAVLTSSGGVLGFDTTALDAKASDILTESQSHPTLAEIEATTVLAKDSTVAKEATLANGTYGLSALNTDLDTLLARATELRLAELDAANIPTDIANVKVDTAAILLDTGTDGVALLPADKFSSETGQAQGGAIGNIILRSAASSTNDLFIGQKISIYSGTGAGQTRGISNYNGTTKVATVARNWTVAPDATSMYRVEHDFGPKVDNGLAVTAGTVNDKTAYSISGTKTTLDALNDITAASVWAVGTRTLSSFGTLVADIWAYATRKLTSRNIGASENIAQEETQIAEHDATQVLVSASSGTGANQVIVQTEIAGGSTPIAGVSVQVLNSGQTLVLARGITDTNGQTTLALDNGTYKVRLYKVGYTFTVPETIVVSGNGTFILDGTVIEIGVPSSANTCRVFEWCFGPDDTTPLTTVTKEAKIVGLPYNYNTKLHAGSIITAVYNSTTGLLYWDIVYGALVQFTIDELGVEYNKIVPSVVTKRLSDIT